jgi:hypothetical protein
MKLSIIALIINLIIGGSCDEKSNNSETSSGTGATTVPTSRDTFYIQDTSRQIAGKTISMTVSYAAIECGCPQWFQKKGENVAYLQGAERFYLEPINKNLINANDLWDGEHLPLILEVNGTLSKKKENPITYHVKGTPEKARIFWYDKIKVISPSSDKVSK